MKKLFLIPNSLEKDEYTDSFKNLFKDHFKLKMIFQLRDKRILSEIYISFVVLTLPLFTTVIIESIRTGLFALMLRPDIKVVHIPRGAGAYKKGWKDEKMLNFLTKLKLKRRNKIIVCSKIFADYLAVQENTSRQKYYLSHEPIVIEGLNYKENRKNGYLLALSENWNKNETNELAESLSISLNEKIFISYHPIQSKKKVFDHRIHYIKGIISDISTISIYGFMNNLDVLIVEPIRNKRDTFLPQNAFFKNINKKEKIYQKSETKIEFVEASKEILLNAFD